MIKKDKLFSLVKSLSKSEKRHFKLFAARQNGGRNYLKLFNAVEEQECYSEQLIKSKFAGENFTNQLHVTKNYLYKLILK